jgi:hypothetical protein
MKLEHIFDEVVYLAPKVYGRIITNEQGKEDFVRIKGLINPISVEELKILLYKGKTLPINQEK